MLAFLFLTGPAAADRLVLRIRAGNPIEKAQTVRIKSNLPPRARTNDILSLDGLELGYDLKSDIYFVHKEVELSPKEIRVFNVEINDIWVIPPARLDDLDQRAEALVGKLEGTKLLDVGKELQGRVAVDLAGIRKTQDANAIRPGGVRPQQHIGAYEANLAVLKRVKKDLGRLENLVLAGGRDPGELVGTVKDVQTRRRDVQPPEGGFKTALVRITVHNTSPRERRRVSVRRDLPPEVAAHDVIDSGELEVGTDPKTGISYVYRKNLELGPNERVTFELKVRDKWDVNGPRIKALDSSASDLLGRVRGKELYASLEKTINGLISELARIEAEPGPGTVNAEYVAFYREQASRLDEIEQKITRIQTALRQTSKKLGFPLKPPSLKTTWLIIYIILGFLAVVSLVFFFRWYGRSKAEKMEI
jgi:hypothetical protein